MTVNQASPVVGVFSSRALAEEAIEALHNIGFNDDQIRYATSSPSGTGRFFEEIKGLFTGAGVGGEGLARDLSSMGLSDEEAHYYTDEYQKGYAIVAVKAQGREQEAMVILLRFGAHNYSSQLRAPEPVSPEPIDQIPASPTTDTIDQAQSPPSSESVDRASPASPDQEQLASDEREQQSHPADESPIPQQDVRPMNEPAAQYSMTQPSTTDDEAEAELSHPDEEHPLQQNQPSVGEHPAPIDYEAELQKVRSQMEETQRQLQEARTQLQSARERHEQMKAHKQREAELQETRKQLQDAQAELQTTLQELHEIQAQIGQPV